MRAVANNTRAAGGGAITIKTRWWDQFVRRVETYTRMIIIEDERTRVILIAFATDALITRAQIAIRQVIRQGLFGACYGLATPRAVLPVCGNNNPFLTERMPAFF